MFGVLVAGVYGSGYCFLHVAGSTNSAVIATQAGNVQTGLGFVAVNDVIGIMVESAGYCTFYKNNVVVGTRQSFTPTENLQFFVEPRVGGGGANLGDFFVNFGQRPFAYTPPTGFKALCQANLPTTETIETSGTFTGNRAADGPYRDIRRLSTHDDH